MSRSSCGSRSGCRRERIVALPASENFWSVGGPGPCGPDSETYWDWGAEHGCGEPDCAPALHALRPLLEFGTSSSWRTSCMRTAPSRRSPSRTSTRASASNARGDPAGRESRSTRPTATARLWTGSPGSPALGSAIRWPRRKLIDPGRPRTRNDVPRGRRRHARERRAWLRPATDPPSSRPAGAAIGLTRRLPGVGRRGRADGRGVPGARRAGARDRARLGSRKSASTRHSNAASSSSTVSRPGGDLGRGGVHARRDLWLSLELTVELAEERGQAVDVDSYKAEMERHREVSRTGGRPTFSARRTSGAAQVRDRFDGYSKPDVITQIGALEEVEDGLSSRSSESRLFIRRQAAR